MAEFGHADDQCQCRPLTDAGDAEHEIETLRQIGMLAQLAGNSCELGEPSRLQPIDVTQDQPPPPWLVDMFEPGLEPGDVFFDLLDERQVI
ncbi:hypothetical protein, partial [Rhodopseudomonas sp. B29]|uniref:hypothetical protein n=1 Tax=Rhodopseudomonas sp. B29 TaxID=95607 RepID=UPI001FCAE740